MYGFEALWFNIKDGYLGMLHVFFFCPGCISAQVVPARRQVFSVAMSAGIWCVGRASLALCEFYFDMPMLRCAADGVVRGHRSGLLKPTDYNNLCQCETLDDIKLNLVCPAVALRRGFRSAEKLDNLCFPTVHMSIRLQTDDTGHI